MTPPARSAPDEPKDAASDAPAGVARWLNVVTTLVLGGGLLVIAFAAAPSLLHAGLAPRAEDQAFPPPVRAAAPRLVPHGHPRSFGPAPGDDADEPDDDDAPPDWSPKTARPTDPRFTPPHAPKIPALDDEPGLGLDLRSGVAARPFELRDRRTNAVIGKVRKGSMISILREEGEWVLIVQKTEEDLLTGWARRSEIQLK